MPDTTVTAVPFVFRKPAVKIGATGTSVDIACGANAVAIEPDQDSTELETFCGTYTSYKAPVWTITVTVLQSFGTTGLWNQLLPLAGTIQPVEIIPDGTKPIAVDNPAMRCSAYVGWPSFLNGAVGEGSEFDLELGVQGTPTWPTTPTVTTFVEGGEGEGTEATPEEQPVPASA
jgi:hypothetical protein